MFSRVSSYTKFMLYRIVIWPKYYLPVHFFSALAGAVVKSQASALTFEAADAAAGFWFFFPEEKGLGLRGYERGKLI